MKRIFLRLPILGILIFIFLYFYAASLYPGGSFFDPQAVGYSQLHNYWCDLLEPVSYYSGQPNSGRFFALIGTTLLPLSLLIFWWKTPSLFVGARWKTQIVRLCGSLSMLLTTLLPVAHDVIVSVAGGLGLVAFAVTLAGLIQAREIKLSLIACGAIVFCIINYLMWALQSGLVFMPVIQKIAFFLLIIWILLTEHRYSHASRPQRL